MFAENGFNDSANDSDDDEHEISYIAPSNIRRLERSIQHRIGELEICIHDTTPSSFPFSTSLKKVSCRRSVVRSLSSSSSSQEDSSGCSGSTDESDHNDGIHHHMKQKNRAIVHPYGGSIGPQCRPRQKQKHTFLAYYASRERQLPPTQQQQQQRMPSRSNIRTLREIILYGIAYGFPNVVASILSLSDPSSKSKHDTEHDKPIPTATQILATVLDIEGVAHVTYAMGLDNTQDIEQEKVTSHTADSGLLLTRRSPQPPPSSKTSTFYYYLEELWKWVFFVDERPRMGPRQPVKSPSFLAKIDNHNPPKPPTETELAIHSLWQSMTNNPVVMKEISDMICQTPSLLLDALASEPYPLMARWLTYCLKFIILDNNNNGGSTTLFCPSYSKVMQCCIPNKIAISDTLLEEIHGALFVELDKPTMLSLLTHHRFLLFFDILSSHQFEPFFCSSDIVLGHIVSKVKPCDTEMLNQCLEAWLDLSERIYLREPAEKRHAFAIRDFVQYIATSQNVCVMWHTILLLGIKSQWSGIEIMLPYIDMIVNSESTAAIQTRQHLYVRNNNNNNNSNNNRQGTWMRQWETFGEDMWQFLTVLGMEDKDTIVQSILQSPSSSSNWRSMFRRQSVQQRLVFCDAVKIMNYLLFDVDDIPLHWATILPMTCSETMRLLLTHYCYSFGSEEMLAFLYTFQDRQFSSGLLSSEEEEEYYTSSSSSSEEEEEFEEFLEEKQMVLNEKTIQTMIRASKTAINQMFAVVLKSKKENPLHGSSALTCKDIEMIKSGQCFDFITMENTTLEDFVRDCNTIRKERITTVIQLLFSTNHNNNTKDFLNMYFALDDLRKHIHPNNVYYESLEQTVGFDNFRVHDAHIFVRFTLTNGHTVLVPLCDFETLYYDKRKSQKHNVWVYTLEETDKKVHFLVSYCVQHRIGRNYLIGGTRGQEDVNLSVFRLSRVGVFEWNVQLQTQEESQGGEESTDN